MNISLEIGDAIFSSPSSEMNETMTVKLLEDSSEEKGHDFEALFKNMTSEEQMEVLELMKQLDEEVDYPDDLAAELSQAENTTLCDFSNKIDNKLADRILFFIAIIVIVIFCFLVKRSKRALQTCYGRPGFVYPANFLEGQKHRFTYVAAYICVSWAMIDMTVTRHRILPFYKHEIYPNAMPFYVLAACIMRAVMFYPVFLSITTNTPYSYFTGFFYTLLMMCLFLVDDRFCFTGTFQKRVLQYAKLLPPAFCLIYLLGFFGYKIICIFRRTFLGLEKIKPEYNWQNSDSALYVKDLLKKRDPEDVYQFKKKSFKSRLKEIYPPMPHFKYSISILAAVLSALCYTYMVSLGMLTLLYYSIEKIKLGMRFAIKIGKTRNEMINFAISTVSSFFSFNRREMNRVLVAEGLFWLEDIIEPLIYVALTLGILSIVTQMLLTLRNYRRNLLLIYRNAHGDSMPKRQSISPKGLIVKAVKFVGYQVAYASWGFIIQMIIISMMMIGFCGFLVLVIRYDMTFLLQMVLKKYWPTIGMLVLLLSVQTLMVQCFFLRKGDHGKKVVALNNRHLFHNFFYFALFTNIAVGLMSCILRMLRSVLYGLWTVPRLDLSTMSRQFENKDAGFSAYVGLLYLEHIQRNPLMLTFINILIEGTADPTMKSRRAYKRARGRYALWLTLERNPGLRLYRKHAEPRSIRKEPTKFELLKKYFDDKNLNLPFIKV